MKLVRLPTKPFVYSVRGGITSDTASDVHSSALFYAVNGGAEGMSGILPVELFSMFTPSEVEAIVCGVPVVDISILQKATDYEGVSPRDPHIQVSTEGSARGNTWIL